MIGSVPTGGGGPEKWPPGSKIPVSLCSGEFRSKRDGECKIVGGKLGFPRLSEAALCGVYQLSKSFPGRIPHGRTGISPCRGTGM